MQQIQLNIIPLNLVLDNQIFAFYGEKQKGFTSIYWDKLFELLLEGMEAQLVPDVLEKYQPVEPISHHQDLEIVDEIFPHFEHNHLPEFGNNNL